MCHWGATCVQLAPDSGRPRECERSKCQVQDLTEDLLRQLGKKARRSLLEAQQKVLFRVFFHPYGDNVLLLLGGYDKAKHSRRMGQEVAEEPKKLGMSQERLAKTTGIDQAEISRIERDIVDPRLGTYVKLLEGVGLGLRVERVYKSASSSPRQVGARRLGR